MADLDRTVDIDSSLSSHTATAAIVAQTYSYAEAADRAATEAISAAISAGANYDRTAAALLDAQQLFDEIESLIANGGLPGAKGDPGDSAYDIAVINGFLGNEVQWLASLEGEEGADGKSAYQ